LPTIRKLRRVGLSMPPDSAIVPSTGIRRVAKIFVDCGAE
jgi:hypothetical protein